MGRSWASGHHTRHALSDKLKDRQTGHNKQKQSDKESRTRDRKGRNKEKQRDEAGGREARQALSHFLIGMQGGGVNATSEEEREQRKRKKEEKKGPKEKTRRQQTRHGLMSTKRAWRRLVQRRGKGAPGRRRRT